MNRSGTKTLGAGFAIFLTIGLPRAETIVMPALGHKLRDTSVQRVAQQLPDRLVVTRAGGNLGRSQLPPLSKTVTDQSLVEKLYGAILALPPFPAGPKNCPMQTDIRYRLDFYRATSSILVANYNPTGCASVRLSDGTVKSAAHGAFAAELAHALGFASQQQLRGLQ